MDWIMLLKRDRSSANVGTRKKSPRVKKWELKLGQQVLYAL